MEVEVEEDTGMTLVVDASHIGDHTTLLHLLVQLSSYLYYALGEYHWEIKKLRLIRAIYFILLIYSGLFV